MICSYKPVTRRVARRMKWKELPDRRWFRVLDRWQSYVYKIEGTMLYQKHVRMGTIDVIPREGRYSPYLDLRCELV